MVDIVKGAGRVSPFHHDGMFGRKWQSPLCVYSTTTTYRTIIGMPENSDVKYITLSVVNRSRIHERAISLRFLGIILRVLRLEVSVFNVYIINLFQITFAQERGGG
jgi:hypothetical protein